MIVYGARNYLIDAGQQQSQMCDRCGQNRLFRSFLQYRSFALYWVFGAVTERKYLQLCEICNRGTEIAKDQVMLHNFHPAPIPFMHRFGLLAFAGIIAGVAGWSIIIANP